MRIGYPTDDGSGGDGRDEVERRHLGQGATFTDPEAGQRGTRDGCTTNATRAPGDPHPKTGAADGDWASCTPTRPTTSASYAPSSTVEGSPSILPVQTPGPGVRWPPDYLLPAGVVGDIEMTVQRPAVQLGLQIRACHADLPNSIGGQYVPLDGVGEAFVVVAGGDPARGALYLDRSEEH